MTEFMLVARFVKEMFKVVMLVVIIVMMFIVKDMERKLDEILEKMEKSNE